MKRITKKVPAPPIAPLLEEASTSTPLFDLDVQRMRINALFNIIGLTCCSEDCEIDQHTLNQLCEIGRDCAERIEQIQGEIATQRRTAARSNA